MHKGTELTGKIGHINKELEEYKYSNLELLREIWFNVPEGSQKIHQKHFDLILSKLNELQAIKEAKPSEALECLEEMAKYRIEYSDYSMPIKDISEYKTIKQALLKSQEQEKVLSIIKKKNVNIGLVKVVGSVEQYNQTYVYDNMRNVKWCLTEEELDLLKRYFK